MVLNANMTIKHVIEIKIGIVINVNESLKSIACVKKILVGILAHVDIQNSKY